MTSSRIPLMLAWLDLWRDRFFLFCNVAVLVGVLVPLMLLYGVKNGVTQALLDDLLRSPTVLQIDTLGNKSFTQAQLETIRSWPEVAFVVPRARAAFDAVYLRREGARRMASATLLPSGAGDPNLPEGLELGRGQVALSEVAARTLDVQLGDSIDLVGQVEPGERVGNLLVPVDVVALIPPSRVDGATVFVPFEISDAFEALYEGYAVPAFGLRDGNPIEDRVAAFEGVRVYARDLGGVVALEARLSAVLDVGTRGSSADIQVLFGLSRDLTLVLAITAGLAAAGLGAALVTGSYADVVRKRVGLASLAMLGLQAWHLAAIPVLQALLTALIGLGIAFPVFYGGVAILDVLFGDRLPGGGNIAILYAHEVVAIVLGVITLCLLSAAAAARSATRIDPAQVLREGR